MSIYKNLRIIFVLGAVFGWGKNEFGQLGLNDNSNKFYPNQLKTLRSIKIKYITCGEDFSVFLTQVCFLFLFLSYFLI